MTQYAPRTGPSWSRRLMIGLLLVLAGAAAATWGLARWQAAARFVGVAPAPAGPAPQVSRLALTPQMAMPIAPAASAATDARVAVLEARLARVENATQRAAGSAGRADALLVAFAARRAIDRGVALGYIESLLVDRFGEMHPRAVAAIVTASRAPVRLDQLDSEYEALAPALRGGAPEDSWWQGVRRELGSVIAIRRADTPSAKPAARYERARGRLAAGQVDAALAETMRLPAAGRADAWIVRARQYIAVHRALDEIESAALLSGGNGLL